MNCPDGKEPVSSQRADGSIFTRCLNVCADGKTRSPVTSRCKKDSTSGQSRNNAQSPRNNAQSPRNNSQSSRNNAQSSRNNSQSSRNNAQSSRNNAQSSRNNAQSSRNNSRSPRNNARSPRNNARSPRRAECLPTEDMLEYTRISKKRGPDFGREVTRRVCKEKCAPGYTRNPDTLRCRKDISLVCKDTHDLVVDPRTNKSRCLVKCKQGYARSETMKCRPDFRASEKTMRQHQLRFVSAFEKSLMNTGEDAKRGAILYHGVGTGKTLTAVQAAAVYFKSGDLEKNVLIICPASIVPVFQAEVNTVLSPSEKKRTRIVSFEGFSNEVVKRKRFLPAAVDRACTENTLLIVDEAQRLANEATFIAENGLLADADYGLSSTSFVMLECGRRVDRVLLLSATPMRNMVIDIVNLLTMIDPTITRNRFSDCEENMHPSECIKILSKCMVSIEPTDVSDAAYPTVVAEDVGFVMTESEQKFYSRAIGDAITRKQLLKEIMRFRQMHHRIQVHEQQREGDERGFYDMPVISLDQPKLNWILWGDKAADQPQTLGLSGRIYGDNTIISTADPMEHVGLCTEEYKRNPVQAVVYSVFVENSVKFLYEELKKCGTKVDIIKGSVSSRNRDKIVKDYNEGRINVIIFTAAGSEGISLKNTRIMYVLQPDWNMARANQAIGRVRRFNSHISLPEQDRTVTVINTMLFLTEDELLYYKAWLEAVEKPEALRTLEETNLVKQNISFSASSVDHYMRWKSYKKQIEIDGALRAIDQPYETCFSD